MTNPTTAGPPRTVNEIIARFPATVGVFNAFGIDACCGGAVTLEEAARRDGADMARLMDALRSTGVPL